MKFRISRLVDKIIKGINISRKIEITIAMEIEYLKSYFEISTSSSRLTRKNPKMKIRKKASNIEIVKIELLYFEVLNTG